jgi:benzylsuccinate CoA-transferase BbsF subunit
VLDADPVELIRPPLLGEHTREVLGRELGMSDDELDALIEEKVLY